MAKKLQDDHLSVGYSRAKANFKKLECPYDKITRLSKVREQKFEEYKTTSEAYDKFFDIYEVQLDKYMDKMKSVQALALTVDDKIDSWNLLEAPDFGVGEHPF